MRKEKIDIIKNAFLSSFSVIENLLEEIEAVLEPKERMFFKIKRNLDQRELKLKIIEIKNILKDLKEKLGIKEEEITDIAIINSRCAKMWEILNDLRSDKLKRYGEIPKEVKSITESSIKKLIDLVNEIVDLTTQKR